MVPLIRLFGAIQIILCWIDIFGTSITLDYNLYSQILNEHQQFDHSEDVLHGDNVLYYFRLNRDTLESYDSYLHFPEKERVRLKEMAKNMFEFGYDNYMKYAFPLDELDPIHCTGQPTSTFLRLYTLINI